MNGRGDNAKGNTAQDERRNQKPSISGQGGAPGNPKAKSNNAPPKDNAKNSRKNNPAPSTSGQATRPAGGDDKPAAKSGSGTGTSMRPQNPSATGNAGGANDNRSKQPQ